MAEVKFSELVVANNLSSSDYIPIIRSGSSIGPDGSSPNNYIALVGTLTSSMSVSASYSENSKNATTASYVNLSGDLIFDNLYSNRLESPSITSSNISASSITSSFSGDLNGTSSYSNDSLSSSYSVDSLSSSYSDDAISSSYSSTSSYSDDAISSSYSLSSSYSSTSSYSDDAISSSYSSTSSYSDNNLSIYGFQELTEISAGTNYSASFTNTEILNGNTMIQIYTNAVVPNGASGECYFEFDGGSVDNVIISDAATSGGSTHSEVTLVHIVNNLSIGTHTIYLKTNGSCSIVSSNRTPKVCVFSLKNITLSG